MHLERALHGHRFGLGLLVVELHRHQPAGHVLAQIDLQTFEQGEGLDLVLVQRVALAIAAQADDVAQVVQVHQVLAPLQIDHLQQEVLLDLTHIFFAKHADAFGGPFVGGLGDALDEFLVGDAFLGRPFGQGQLQAQ